MALNLFASKKKPVKKTHKNPAKEKKVHIKKSKSKKTAKKIKTVKKIKVVKKPVKKTTIVKKKIAIKTPVIEKMDDQKVYELAIKSRLPVLKTIFIKKEKDIDLINKIGFPCYMKVSGSKIIHKSEVDGIIKISSIQEAEEAFKKLMKIKFAEKVLVQEAKEGFELILGSKNDSQFGQVVSIGLGGIYVEIMKDVRFRICPVTSEDADAMIKELNGYEILAGARGKKPIDFKSLEELIVKICRFSLNNKIKEMDINPLFCDDKGCYISDIRIIK